MKTPETPEICIAVAMDERRGIGIENKLPWDIPEDLSHFKKITGRSALIMGRKTYESIIARNGKPLPFRRNIILTSRAAEGFPPYVSVCRSWDKAMQAAYLYGYRSKRLFVIGGANVFEQTLPLADRLFITIVSGKWPADVYFPDYSEFSKVESVEEVLTAQGLKIKFLELTREDKNES